jgi:hypothetical protein
MFKPISRRTLLRGAGAGMSLPWLEIMAKAAPATAGGAQNLSEPPLRMAFLLVPNGVRPDHWTPAGDELVNYEITPHLKPVEAFRKDFLLIENLWNKNSIGRNGHWPKVPVWLSGGYVQRTTADDLDTGAVSVDQFTAQKIGDRTPLPSIELGIDAPRTGIDTAGGGFARLYGSFLSWRDPHTPVPKEIVPQLAFDRLFRGNRAPVVSSLNPNDPSVVAALQRDDTSVLDLVLDDAKKVRSQGSRSDQVRLDEYFQSVRSVEERMAAALKPQRRWINQGKFPLERPAPGIPDVHKDHVRLMLDILVLAFWSDTTRIGTFMFGDAQTMQDYSFLEGVKGGFHSLSHHGNVPEVRTQYEKIVTWHAEQLAYFLNRVKNLDEGGTSLLDNSMFMYGGTLKDGNQHLVEDLPILLAGRGKGTIKPGRRLRAPEHTPLCNLYVSMLQRMGLDAKQFGDSTGALEGLA